MKAEELRIGNYVINDCDDSVMQVTAQDILTFSIDEDWLLPIPLTEEWLLKFSFKRSLLEKENPNEGYYYTKEISDNKYCDLALMSGDKNGFIEVYLFPYDNIRFKFVHQLQNLYHSLTNKELK